VLPFPVRRFLERRIDNVEQLEIVLLLHQNPDRSWTAADVGAALRLDERAAAQHLETVARHNLLDVRLGDAVRYRFGPSSTDLMAAVRQVAEQYRSRRGEVVAYVAARRRSLRDFADAFRLTKDKDDG
jgi:hypothetical protein